MSSHEVKHSNGPLSSHIGSMGHGEHMDVSNEDSGLKFGVDYRAEQALGDNGLPAKGYTVGHFGVSGPGEGDYKSFRHSPHGPTLEGAKGYAAGQAAEHISSRIRATFNDRRGEERQ